MPPTKKNAACETCGGARSYVLQGEKEFCSACLVTGLAHADCPACDATRRECHCAEGDCVVMSACPTARLCSLCLGDKRVPVALAEKYAAHAAMVEANAQANAQRLHTKDADCAPFLDTTDPTVMAECSVCGVSHGDPCPACGGCGFHADGCAALAEEEATSIAPGNKREQEAGDVR